MIRRQARQRRDYLYRKALTLRTAETAARRARQRASLAQGTSASASKTLTNTTSNTNDTDPDADADLDDEYSTTSGLLDPRPLITTSRSPSSRLATFAKEFRLLFPTATRLNRGKVILPELSRAASAAGVSDVCVLHEHRGVPTALTVAHLPHGPTARFALGGVVLRADIAGAGDGAKVQGRVGEGYPHLVFEGFGARPGSIGRRVVQILKHLFPPREDPGGATQAGSGRGAGGKGLGTRVITFRNVDDTIHVRHHVFVQTSYQTVELAEVGPRFTMRLFEVRSGGSIDAGGARAGADAGRDGLIAGGDVEWHLTQYTRTSGKRNHLGP